MATTQASHGWDRSIVQCTMSSAPMLNFQLASSMPAYTTPSLSLTQAWDAPRTTGPQPPQLRSIPEDMASLQRQKELLEAAVPVTLTPATRRVSKAKKGKRVHLCLFPGCNKVFTRNEHRIRHELSHKPQTEFRCPITGCGKGFYRNDLLTRHLEKHGAEGRSLIKASPARRRKNSRASTLSDRPTSRPTPILEPQRQQQHHHHQQQQQLTPIPQSLPSSAPEIVTTSVDSLALPPASISHSYGGDFAPTWGQPGKSLQKSLSGPHTPYTHVDDIPFSSPGSSRSSATGSPFPMSSQFPVTDQFPDPIFTHHLTTSPTLMSTYPAWTPLEAVTTQPAQMLPATSFAESMPQTVGEPSLICCPPRRKVIDGLPPAVPVPLSDLDGNEWFALRRELTSAPGVVSGNDGMAVIDLVKWQDCFECYWQYFHPLFPIVHRPSFSNPSPLMAGAMVAIGSQYDQRPHSKEYSLALLEACQKILSQRGAITSRSRIADIQAVFLLEVLSKYRSRTADVKTSHRLRSLYGSFIQDGHWASQNPLAVFQSLPSNPKPADLSQAHKSWVEHETRRRVLQAAFILEVQQSLLFQQPLATFLQSTLDPAMREYRISPKVDLPFPCSSKLWESSDITQWAKNAKEYEAMVSSMARERILKAPNGAAHNLDPFQASLIFSQTLPNTDDLENKMQAFVDKVARGASGDSTDSGPSSSICFMYHALLAAKHAPLRALLTVSGETWLFNRKVSETEFQTANEQVRKWVSNTTELKKAFWHAMHVLQCATGSKSASSVPRTPPQGHLSLDNIQFLSPSQPGQFLSRDSTPTPELVANPKTSFMPPSTATVPQLPTGPLTMLQSNWVLYFCTLICWTYENRTSPTRGAPATHFSPITPVSPNTSPISVHQYTSNFLNSPSSSTLQNFLDTTTTPTLPSNQSHDLTAVLEHIYFLILSNASGHWGGGGLLNEAERVLLRLIEQNQRRHFQHFQRQRQQQQHTAQVQIQQHNPAWEFGY